MKVYIAGAYVARNVLREQVVPQLDAADHVCTSSWLLDNHPITEQTIGCAPGQSDEYVNQHVTDDFADILNADVLMLFTARALRELAWWLPVSKLSTGGRHVEHGFAVAKGKPVIIVGPEAENVFQRANGLVPTVNHAITLLNNMESFKDYPKTAAL